MPTLAPFLSPLLFSAPTGGFSSSCAMLTCGWAPLSPKMSHLIRGTKVQVREVPGAGRLPGIRQFPGMGICVWCTYEAVAPCGARRGCVDHVGLVCVLAQQQSCPVHMPTWRTCFPTLSQTAMVSTLTAPGRPLLGLPGTGVLGFSLGTRRGLSHCRSGHSSCQVLTVRPQSLLAQVLGVWGLVCLQGCLSGKPAVRGLSRHRP